MHLLHCVIIFCKLISVCGSQTYVSRSIIDLDVADKPWFGRSFLLLSLQLSQSDASVWFHRYQQRYERGHLSFGLGGLVNSNHATALRWLLIVSGNVELNPGPVNYEFLQVAALKALLQTLHEGDAAFAMPASRDEMVTALRGANQTVVSFLVQKVCGLELAPPAASQQAAAATNTRVIRLPDFYQHDTKTWFNQVEQILQAECQSEHQWKISLLRAIDTQTLKVSGTDMSWPYDQIKRQIITHFDQSDEQKLRELLSKQTLGDDKPSTVLRRMQHLAPGDEKVVRFRFMEILPQQVKVVLATLADMELTKLAEAADKMVEQLQPSSATVASAGFTSSSSHADASSNRIDSLEQQLRDMSVSHKEQLSQLTAAVHAISFSGERRNTRQRFGDRRTSPTRSRSPSPRRDYPENHEFCFYHYTFGPRAKRCKSPCSWSPSGSDSRRHQSGNGYTPREMRPPSE